MSSISSPKPVVLKKSLVVVALAGLSGILALIFHNLYQTTHTSGARISENEQVQLLATANDVSWYQQQEMKEKIHQSLRSQKITSFTPSPQPLVSPPEINPEKVKNEVEKAMKAPIASNQLTGDLKIYSGVDSSNDEKSQLRISDFKQSHHAENELLLQATKKVTDDNYLGSLLKDPVNPYELQTGTIIPAILISGINSDLPGQVIGQVRSNVYDSIAGKYLLIPQGAKLSGVYDSQVVYGQERVMVVWKRIIFPNGQSINLQEMPGMDSSGYSGFNDDVNNHYKKMFGAVLLMSVLSAGAQLSQPQNSNNPFSAPTVGQTIAQSLGTNLANTATMVTSKNIEIKPTLEIRPGYEFNVSVTKDIVFPGEYGSDQKN